MNEKSCRAKRSRVDSLRSKRDTPTGGFTSLCKGVLGVCERRAVSPRPPLSTRVCDQGPQSLLEVLRLPAHPA